MESLSTDRNPAVIDGDGSCYCTLGVTRIDRCIVRGDEK